MNILQKIALITVIVLTAATHPHMEEVEAHTPCPLLFKQDCVLLK